MKLTPLDIRHKEFKRGMRGYADVEVDEFLDEVADEFERLFKENIDLRESVETLEEKVAGYQRIEETLQKTLVNAQASAEEQKQNANKQAELILQDAELKSRELVNQAYSERQSIEQSLAKLRNGEEDFRFKFRQLLEGYLRQIEEQGKPPAAKSSPDLTAHAETIKEAIARESAAEVGAEPVASAPVVAAREEPGSPPPRRPAPQAPAVTPARGPGGIQAGVHRPKPEPDDPAAESEVTMSHPVAPGTPGDAEGTDGAGELPPAVAGEPDAAEGASPVDRAAIDAAGASSRDAPATDAPADDDAPSRRERILFGETDDLLADVDSGVNENEFKW